MNYKQAYDNLIEKWKKIDLPFRSEGTHRHHIVAKSLGGSDEPENFVVVPYRVHFVLHRLYAKFDGTGKMAFAAWIMANNNKKFAQCSSRTYSYLCYEFAEAIKNMWSDNNSYVNSKEYRDKLAKSSTKRWKTKEYREIFFATHNSPEAIAKMREKAIERWQDNEYRRNVSNWSRFYWSDDEWRKTAIEAQKNGWTKSARENQSVIKKEQYDKNPEYRENVSLNSVNMWKNKDSGVHTKEYRENQLKTLKRIRECADCQKKKSESMKKKWEDEEYRDKKINSTIDKTVYKLVNKNTTEEFIGLRYHFYKKYGVKLPIDQFKKGRMKSIKGWQYCGVIGKECA